PLSKARSSPGESRIQLIIDMKAMGVTMNIAATDTSKSNSGLVKLKSAVRSNSAIWILGAASVDMGTSAQAQTAPEAEVGNLEEIIVTAQKRAENIQDVPISITVMDSSKMDRVLGGGQDVNSLAAQVPGFYSSTSNGRLGPRFYVRGVGNTA